MDNIALFVLKNQRCQLFSCT